MSKCYLSDEARQNGLSKCKERNIEKWEHRLLDYANNPKLCGYCLHPLPYAKRINLFCNHSCAASMTNKGTVRNYVDGKGAKKNCLNCSAICDGEKFCSKSCTNQYAWQERVREIELTGSLISYRTDKKYLIEKRGHKCEDCSVSIWKNLPVALVLDHIDGNSDNNRLDNVRLLCPNCNAITPTFCGKNKGNGRSKRKKYRNERYRDGLSY